MLILHLLRLVFDFFRTTFQLLTIPAETGCVTNRQQIKFCCESIFHEIIRTSNIDIDNYCRAEFNFELPGTVIEQRTIVNLEINIVHVTIFIVNCCV